MKNGQKSRPLNWIKGTISCFSFSFRTLMWNPLYQHDLLIDLIIPFDGRRDQGTQLHEIQYQKKMGGPWKTRSRPYPRKKRKLRLRLDLERAELFVSYLQRCHWSPSNQWAGLPAMVFHNAFVGKTLGGLSTNLRSSQIGIMALQYVMRILDMTVKKATALRSLFDQDLRTRGQHLLKHMKNMENYYETCLSNFTSEHS